MADGPRIARVAALIGDPARAEILTALLSGRALTATELAAVAGVTKQTASAHLAKLLDARLLAMERQGRHRYFRLAERDVADLLESLMGVAQRSGAVRMQTGPREPALRRARVCYDHLAGELGVLAYEAFKKRRFLRVVEGELDLTPAGRAFFDDLGASWERSARRPVCRPCLDWSERRHHLAGSAGAAFLDRIQQLGWARRQKDSRVVAFTPRGEAAFREALSG